MSEVTDRTATITPSNGGPVAANGPPSWRLSPWRRLYRCRQWLRLALPSAIARAGIRGPLPNFLIIGTQRGGTTYLYDLLLDHRHITPGLVKEIHFFERHFARGLAWYRANFLWSRVAAWRRASGRVMVGEATADYLFCPCVPQRVYEAIPGVKLIALLRNPIDRAYSHYQLERQIGVEQLPFEAAIEAEAERLGRPLGEAWPDEVEPDFNGVHFSYLTKGLYADQLRRWIRLFPDNQLLIINSEQLYVNPQRVLDQVTDFLELPPWNPRGRKKTNSLRYPPMAPETRKMLLDFYRSHNEALYQLLGTSFDWDR